MVGEANDRRDDTMLRGMVKLIESQAAQIESLRSALRSLEGRLEARARVDVLLAHEMRNPLTVVLGVLQSLDEVRLPEDADRELVGRACVQAAHLSELINDVLAADPEGPVYTRASVRSAPLGQLVNQACIAVSGRLPVSRVHLEVDQSLVVQTAPSRFVAILVNLLDNAAKYGGSHVVDLAAAIEDGALVLQVRDRGPGLDGADPEDLFAPFSRGPGDVPGHGVGLYLVRMLVASLGGTVTLADRPGGGLVATVALPQRRADNDGTRHLSLVPSERTLPS